MGRGHLVVGEGEGELEGKWGGGIWREVWCWVEEEDWHCQEVQRHKTMKNRRDWKVFFRQKLKEWYLGKPSMDAEALLKKDTKDEMLKKDLWQSKALSWTAVGGRKFKWFMRLPSILAGADNGEISEVKKCESSINESQKCRKIIFWGLRGWEEIIRFSCLGLGVGVLRVRRGVPGHCQSCSLPLPLPSIPHSAGRRASQSFLGHTAQLFTDWADKRGS